MKHLYNSIWFLPVRAVFQKITAEMGLFMLFPDSAFSLKYWLKEINFITKTIGDLNDSIALK